MNLPTLKPREQDVAIFQVQRRTHCRGELDLP
jgi:hypothetical protein